MDGVVTFGVPQLDSVLAPIPRGSTLLFLNDPGVDGEPFAYECAASHLAAGDRVVYVVTNRPPSAVVRSMDAFGWGVAEHGERLSFIDAYSPLVGSSENARYEVRDPRDPTQLANAIERAADENPDAVLVIDSLSSLADLAAPGAFAQLFPRLVRAMRRFRLSSALFTRWSYPEDTLRALAAFDGTVTLSGVEERVLLSQYFTVSKAPWAPPERKPRLYKAVKPGGVLVYIPKIVVTGPYNAGKSTFIHSVSDSAVSADRLGTTVALDHGHVTLDGLTADIFGTPGQQRFDPLLKMVATQALGVIVVVDATKPESFERAKEMMTHTWRQGLPAVIAANKQDSPGALPPEEVARLIDPPAGVLVLGCKGADRESGRIVLRALIDHILAGGARS